MTTKWRLVVILGGVVVAGGLAAVAVLWGPGAVEAVSWVAGTASLAVALLTLYVTWPRPAGTPQAPSDSDAQPPEVNQNASAKSGATTYQAGRDINRFDD